jgi:hypothetical protein
MLHIDENGDTLTQDEVINGITHGRQPLFDRPTMDFS